MHFLPAHDPRLEFSFPLTSVQWLQIYTTNKHLLSSWLGPATKQQISSMWYVPKIPPNVFDWHCNTGEEKTWILLIWQQKVGERLYTPPFPQLRIEGSSPVKISNFLVKLWLWFGFLSSESTAYIWYAGYIFWALIFIHFVTNHTPGVLSNNGILDASCQCRETFWTYMIVKNSSSHYRTEEQNQRLTCQ